MKATDPFTVPVVVPSARAARGEMQGTCDQLVSSAEIKLQGCDDLGEFHIAMIMLYIVGSNKSINKQTLKS